jgi:phage terminase large subunit
MKAEIQIPAKIARNFANPVARFHVLKGGRGSAKTRGAAAWCAARAIMHAQSGRRGVILCGREHLNSLEESSLPEIKETIASHEWMKPLFEVGEKYIRTKCGRVHFAFAGLRHNLDSLKSKARILDAWVDEAENVSDTAWRKLIPTIREDGSKLVITYNPENPESATHRRFVQNQHDDICVTHVNWRDNPWFPDVLNNERLRDLRNSPETYEHVWEGAFFTQTDAQIFAGKIHVHEFEPQQNWDGPYYGGDFGFSQDPTAAVEVWIAGDELHIRREAFKTGLELDDTAAFVRGKIPRFELEVSRWDNARPESISYLKRHGLPRATACDKWQGSVEDGLTYLRSFRKIVIHPECDNMQREARLYSYKVDRLTGDVTTKIVDAHNHGWDAVRYAVGPMIRNQSEGGFAVL